jgi:hypothetical protein
MHYFRFKHFYRRRDRICIVEKKYLFLDELALGKPIKRRRDLERLVRLRVEAISPFPLDDLLYGFFANESKLVLFIAYKHRLGQIILEQPPCILPEILPSLITGRDFALTRIATDWDNAAIFHGAGEDLTLKLSDPVVFNADLREFPAKVHGRNLKKILMFLDCGICLNLVIIPLLCAFSAFLLFQGMRLNSLEKQVSEPRAEVADVVSKHAFLERVSKFYSSENFCLAALETVNKVRPDDVLFTDVHADSDEKILRIKGTAPSVSLVTRYCDLLRHCESVEILEPSRIHSRDRRAFFTVDIHFK